MTTREDVFDAGAEASAITAAWAQVDTEELAAALRDMPSKARGRMLQRLKTPAQRITPTAARLLLTNLGRSSTALRYKVAESVTHPIIHAFGDTVDDVGRRPSDVAELVAAVEERWGRTILVLAAVCGMSIDPSRFASVFAACGQLGWLAGELADLAGPIANYAEELAEDADDTGEEDDGTLSQLWDAARAAATRVGGATDAGAAPEQADLDALGRYRRVLLEEAEAWDVGPTVAAVEAAAAASAEAAQVESLASLLARLEGPDTLAADLDEVRGASDRLGEDPDLAARLSRLVDVVSEDDPDRRFALSAPLVAGPPPPSAQLVLAAAAGALRLAEPPGFAASPFDDDDEPPDTTGASERAGSDRPALDSAASSQQNLLGADEAARPGTLFAPHADAGLAAVDDLDGIDDLGDGAAPEEAPTDGSGGGPEVASGDGGDDTDGDTEASAEQAAATPSASDADEAAPAPDAEEAVTVLDEEAAPVVDEEPSPQECNQTLAGLIAARRFSLAHHLAGALGQTQRAELFAEAAVAHGVRRATSPAARDVVDRAFGTLLSTDDRGSIALRAASVIRGALLAPASQAAEALRPILDPLGTASEALRDFALAVIDAASTGVTIPASGVTGGSAPAFEEADVIAAWAEDALSRPRSNRLYRGTEIWNLLTAPDQPLGRILAAVASNDRRAVPRVRKLCAEMDSRALDKAVDGADAAFGGRNRGDGRHHGGARAKLRRDLAEIVEQAAAWCEALGSEGTDSGLGRLELAANELRQRLGGLVPDGLDPFATACLYAAIASLSETIGLLFGESLDGPDLDPDEAVHRELVLVNGLRLDEHNRPERPPTLAELVAASQRSRAVAFEHRLGTWNFPEAEGIIALPETCGGPLDEAAATKELRAAMRDATPQIQARWKTVEAAYNAARARGRLDVTDAAVLGGALAHAEPAPAGDTPRADLGRVADELDGFTRDLAVAEAERAEVVRAELDAAYATASLSEQWRERLERLFAAGEIGAAEEYLHRSLDDTDVPDDDSELHRPDEMLGRILAAHPDGVTAEVIAAVRAAALDFSGLDEATRSSVAESLNAWTVLAGPERPPNLEELLAPVLRLLGITQRAVNRPPALRAASTGDYFFVEVEGTDAGPYAYVPDYGSRAAGRRRFMLCFTDTLPVSQLWSLARANSLDDQPMYVLYFKTLSARARVELAGVARRSNTKGLVVFDAAVLLRCAVEGRQTWDVPMRATLPYAAPNPYDPDLLAGVPPEMFYGRRRERESLKDFDGTSIISGGRRFGKTALLRSALGELQRSDPDLVGMLIGIQNIGAEPRNDPAKLWPRVAAALVGARVLPADTDGTADAVYAGIQAWLAANERKRLMLMLDECDSFLRADADHGFGNVALLRDLMGGADRRFKVVFSGLQHVARYNRLPNQPLTHFAESLVIGPLDATSASKLVRRPLHAVGWAISDAQVDRIVTYCACNPAVIQLTCAALINRLRATEPTELAPWGVDDGVIDAVLGSKEIADGVRERLFHTLNLDDRYKLLAYMLAERALTDGLAQAVPPTELRRMAISWWPEGFDSEGADDVRNLCEELVGLGIFAGDASGGYRMLSPGTIRVFGDAEKINEELHWASERYRPTRAVDAAGSRMRLEVLGPQRYSPLTATQLADVLRVGSTQLRIVVGSRATRVDAVYSALAAAQALYPKLETREARTLREWRERMRAPESGHLVVVSDMTSRVHQDSWEESIALSRRRGATRTARGTRAAVLVAGPSERWLLRRLVTLPDGTAGDLSGEAVALHRVDAPALQAWDRIDDLDLALPVQHRLLEVTGGWPSLIERVLSARADVGLSAALNAMETELAEPAGARRLVAAAGLDLGDEDQPADPGLVATFDWLVDAAFAPEPLDYLADLLGEADDLRGEDNPAEAVAILALLGALAEAEPGRFGVEPRLAAAWRLLAPAAAS